MLSRHSTFPVLTLTIPSLGSLSPALNFIIWIFDPHPDLDSDLDSDSDFDPDSCSHPESSRNNLISSFLSFFHLLLVPHGSVLLVVFGYFDHVWDGDGVEIAKGLDGWGG